MKLENRGYMLLEIILAITIGMLVVGAGSCILYNLIKAWGDEESKLEISYNLKESLNSLTDEIRGCYGVEILDASNGNWIKVYKSEDKSKFITYRAKNNKLFIGYNNIVNPNSELANFIKSFKVNYLPLGVTESENASGVKIELKLENNKKSLDSAASVAFRIKCRE